MIWREFKAMGTEIIFFTCLRPEQQNILIEAENAVSEFEKRFSRFIDNNELANFNNSLKTELEVSETMVELLRESKNYFIKTGGIYDPTIIGSLEKIGYDKNFAALDFKSEINKQPKVDAHKIQREFALRFKINDIRIEDRKIRRPIGLRIDFGGIGKGYIVDNLSQTVFSGLKNYWISAGGDILASGNSENGIGFDIGVQNPLQPAENIFFINTKGETLGIATSGIIKRSGQSGDFKWNHLIDPRTGLSVENDILAVTVISTSAIKADIYAKTVLILGEEAGLNFIERETDSACLIFKKNKELVFSTRAHLYLKK